MPNFQFLRRANWPWRDKVLSVPQRGQNIIVNQSKAILLHSRQSLSHARISGKIICHGKLIGPLLLRLYLNGLVHRKPTKCDIHGHFCLIFGNIVIFTNLNTLILTIIVAKLNFRVKMAFIIFC